MQYHAHVRITSSPVFGNRRLSSAGKSSQCICNDTLAPVIWQTPFDTTWKPCERVSVAFFHHRDFYLAPVSQQVYRILFWCPAGIRNLFFIKIEIVSLSLFWLHLKRNIYLGWVFLSAYLLSHAYGFVSIISRKKFITSLILSILNFSCLPNNW